MPDVTRLLDAAAAGDPKAAGELLPLVYDELRRLAAHRLAHERPGQTLQATALVHEAYLRLVVDPGRDEELRWNSRGHFFAAAAEAMRQILVESARRRRAIKHGGGQVRLSLEDDLLAAAEPREDLPALDEALTRLAATNRPAADLVQLRYFAGLTLPEAAEAMEMAPRTAGRLGASAGWCRRASRGRAAGRWTSRRTCTC